MDVYLPRFLYVQLLKSHYCWQNAYASLLNPRCLTGGTFFDAPTTGLAKLSFLAGKQPFWMRKAQLFASLEDVCSHGNNAHSQQEFTNNNSD